MQKGMDALMHGRTVFVIAHRLSTVRNSDVIMVLEHGRIIERGSHDELIAQKGKPTSLFYAHRRGEAQNVVLENELIKLTFNTRGGTCLLYTSSKSSGSSARNRILSAANIIVFRFSIYVIHRYQLRCLHRDVYKRQE